MYKLNNEILLIANYRTRRSQKDLGANLRL